MYAYGVFSFHIYRSDCVGVCGNARRAAAVVKDNGFLEHWSVEVCCIPVQGM